MKFFIVTVICACFLTGTTYSQRNTSVEAIFKKVWEEKEAASNYLSTLRKVDSRDKHFSVAQYIIHQAFVEKAQAGKLTTAYNQITAYYDSAVLFLDKCQTTIEQGSFAKEIDFYLPMVNEYGIYESEAQLKHDLYALFDAKTLALKEEITQYETFSHAFESVTLSYQRVIQSFEKLREKYPLKGDLVVLEEQTYKRETDELFVALDSFEIAKQHHDTIVSKFYTSSPFPIYGVPISNYTAKINSVEKFRNTGEYTIISAWLEQIQTGRIEKLGNFWVSFSMLYDSLNWQLTQLTQKKAIKSPIKIPTEIFNKVRFIDAESAMIPYLSYLEQKQLFLYQLQSKKESNDLKLIKLYGILQQSKLSLNILQYRLNEEGIILSKDALFYEKLGLSAAELKVFTASESDFLRTEESKISTGLKTSLVNNFLTGRFEPAFTKYGEIRIPLYEQKAGFLKEGQAITTRVFKVDEHKLLIGGTINSRQSQPFVALVEHKKIVWLTKSIFPESAMSFAGSYDYFHCSALFKTTNGWGGIYYPGLFSGSNVRNKQGGLLVLFDKLGRREKMLPLPVMQPVDVVSFNQVDNEYIMLAENSYLSKPYQTSEILSLGSDGEVKWKKVLPIKSFSSLLALKGNNIFLFANCMEQVPGESHFNSSVSVFEMNAEGVIMKEKKLETKMSAYATQVLQDEQNHWLIFGFNGDNDLYNLRDKDIFFYMLDHSFDNVGGGELTSVGNP